MKTTSRSNITTPSSVALGHLRGAMLACVLGVTIPLVSAGPVFYYNGAVRQAITLDSTRSAEFAHSASALAARSLASTSNWQFVTLRPVPAGVTAAAGVGRTSPVFREGDSPAGRLMALPGGVMVEFKPDWTPAQIGDWLSARVLTVDQRLGIAGNWYVIHSAPGWPALDLANAIHESGDVVSASPNWWKETTPR